MKQVLFISILILALAGIAGSFLMEYQYNAQQELIKAQADKMKHQTDEILFQAQMIHKQQDSIWKLLEHIENHDITRCTLKPAGEK